MSDAAFRVFVAVAMCSAVLGPIAVTALVDLAIDLFSGTGTADRR